MTIEQFLEKNVPELPEQATLRLMNEYGLSEDMALVITGDPPAVGMYEEAIAMARTSLNGTPKRLNETVANWLCNDVFALVKESVEAEEDYSVENSRINGAQLGELVALISEGTISTTMAKKILAVLNTDDDNEYGKSPRQVAEERNWKLISDMEILQDMCEQVIEAHPQQLEQYKKGGKHVRKMKKFFLGKTMAHSKGNAQPELLNDALEEVLERTAPGIS